MRLNIPLIVSVGIIVVLGVLLAVSPKPSVVTHKMSTPLPAVATSTTPFTVTFEHPEVQPVLKLHFMISGKGVLLVEGKQFALEPGLHLRKAKMSSNSYVTSEGTGYDIVTKLKGGKSRVSIIGVGDKQVDIRSFGYDVVKYKQLTTLNILTKQDIAWLILGLSMLAVVSYLMLDRFPMALQYAGLCLITAFFVYIEWVFAVILFAFLIGMYQLRHRYKGSHSALLFIFVLSSACFLVFFKFAKGTLADFLANPAGLSLLMPIGISYFVIRLIDIQLRWYRGQSTEYTLVEYLYFIVFPGTLMAGPIETIENFYQKRLTTITNNDVARGVGRILIGLFKKIIIAEVILYPPLHGTLLASSSRNRMVLDAGMNGGDIIFFGMMGVLFAYIDFSAYSDIAIGSSRLLGHRIRENFNFPIFAPNLREYWQRWHMSLSEWAFKNVYFPLLIKTRNQYLPLYATMLTIGIWHAWNLSWFSWAMHHATGMTVVTFFQKKAAPFLLGKLDSMLPGMPSSKALQNTVNWGLRCLSTALTLTFVSMGFIFVYYNDYSLALSLYLRCWTYILTLGGLL